MTQPETATGLECSCAPKHGEQAQSQVLGLGWHPLGTFVCFSIHIMVEIGGRFKFYVLLSPLQRQKIKIKFKSMFEV